MSTPATAEVTATARAAGSGFVHTVTDWYGRPAGQRRSARTYSYAIVRRIKVDGQSSVSVVRWSDSPRASAGTWAIKVETI